MSEVAEGVDHDAISGWFAQNVSDVQLPLQVELIAGGHSNLTYSLTEQPAADGAEGRRWVLRRPPLGQVLATAHDVVREHRIISALANSKVPVPRTVGVSADDSVNGAPFYVMDFVDGQIIRSANDAKNLDVEVRRRAGESLVNVLAAIHSVDVDEVGLGDLARREDYVARQLKRWYGQFEHSETQVEGGLGLPSVHEIHDLLLSQIPTQHGSTIVHGDYRLDNAMIGADGQVAAVLDWEICTLGDPLADVGLLWVYWTDPGDDAVLPQAAPTALDGFPTKVQIMERYERESGRDLTDLQSKSNVD
ncbi:MAG TPA: phosphotransferase family protein, partial [Microthrixaceae bacterium]|nr:phosphotransferase family protein [Microthrixaceae bacterium]